MMKKLQATKLQATNPIKEVLMPNGMTYRIKKKGIYLYANGAEEYVADYMNLTATYCDYESGDLFYKFEYQGLTRIEKIVLPSTALLSTNEVFQTIAAKGYYVTYAEQNHLVKLLNFIAKEHQLLYTTSKLGFITNQNEETYFVLDKPYPYDTNQSYHFDMSAQPKNFNLGQAGNWETWQSSMKKHVVGHTPLELITGIALSAIAVGRKNLTNPNFGSQIFHLGGRTSTGKTTATELAISMFGTPGLNKGLYKTFDATENALIHGLSGVNGLPLGLDELNANINEDFTRFIYKVGMGRDKRRLTDEIQQRETGQWTTTLITNGEESILQKTNANEGLIIRAIELNNIPWTKDATHADEVKSLAHHHYGLAAHKYLTYLTNNWTVLDDAIAKWQTYFTEAFKGFHTGNRLAERYALVVASLQIASEAFDLDFSLTQVSRLLVDVYKANQRTIDSATYFLLELQNYISTHPKLFAESKEKYSTLAHNGFYIEDPSATSIMIEGCILDELITQFQIKDKNRLLKQLKQKGHLVHEPDRLTQRIHLNRTSRMIMYGFILLP